MRNIGDEIKKARKEAGLRQKDLAERLNVSTQLISQYETGLKNPKLETLYKIAEALDIKPAVLVARSLDLCSVALESDDWEELELVSMFRELNNNGRAEALKRVGELTEIERYIINGC